MESFLKRAFSSPAKTLMQFIPLPNQGQFFVSNANTNRMRDDLGGVRLDFNSNRWGTLTAYYHIDDNYLLIPFGDNNFPGFPTSNNGRSQLITLSDTKSFGATGLNELRLSFNRYVAQTDKPASGTGSPLSSFGFPEGVPGAITAVDPASSGVPLMFFNNYSFGLSPVVLSRFEDTPAFLDNFTKAIGAHTVKFGGQYAFNNFYEPFPPVGGNGVFTFVGGETGTDFSDFLIGATDNVSQGAGFKYDNLRSYVGVFGQDSWRLRPDFTLNYGLRYEVFQPWYEKSNQTNTLVLGEQSTVYPGAPKGYVFPGDPLPGGGKIPRTISPTPLHNLAPRLGFAYSPSSSNAAVKRLTGGAGKSSIRGGFGMFYTNMEGTEVLDLTGLPPFSDFYNSPTPPLLATPYVSRSDGTIYKNPFPFTPPTSGSTNIPWANYLPISGDVPSVNNRTSYSESYNLTLQRQFGHNTLLTLGYVGGQGHRLLASLPSNPGNQSLCLSLSQPSDVAPGTPTCAPFSENGVYTRANGTTVNGTRGPFGPNFEDFVWNANVANSSYNSLQVSLRYATGPLTFLASYAYSKSMDDASSIGTTLNPINQQLGKGLSSFDMTHNFVISYDYLLPFERLTRNHGSRLAGGWHLVGITRFTTGLAINLSETDDRSLLGVFGINGYTSDTPNFLGGKLSFTNPRSGKPYFNTALFTPDALGEIGTANRAFFHGPGINNFDLALSKDLRLNESKTMEFRGEFFNSFNHAQFPLPSGNINANFGMITYANAPRIGQVAVKFLF